MDHSSLDEIIAKYLSAESGNQPERERLIADHPHFDVQLWGFFADLDQMNRVVRDKVEGTVDFSPSVVPSNAF